MRKLTALVAAVAMLALTFTSCGTGTTTNTTSDGTTSAVTTSDGTTPAVSQKLHYAFLDEPPGIDPGVSVGSTQSTIYATLYEGLVSVDANGKIVPAAAKTWEVGNGGMQYTFKLKDGLKWSDGKALTAKDFEYAWLRVLTPKTASAYSWFVEAFIKNGSEYAQGKATADQVGVKAVDEKTLVVDLKIPASYFIQALLASCWLPVRQDVVEANPEKWCFDAKTAISNGPFKFVEYAIGDHFTVEKNPEYWNKDSVKLDTIKFSFITDSNTALAAFKANQVDGIAGVPAAEFVNLMNSDDRLHVSDGLAFSFIRLNTVKKGLDNVKVRRAINLAFDREAYLNGMGDVASKPALGTVPGGIFLAGKEFREYSGDNGLSTKAKLEEAKALLAEAGYPDGKGLPTYTLHCMDKQVTNAQIVQEMLKNNLGIQTEIKPVDSKLFFPMMVDGKYDIGFGSWGGDYNHPMTFLELFTSTATDNCTGWKNQEYDNLINSARMETDEAKALDYMVKAEHILMQESPIFPILYPTNSIMMQDYVKGWFINPSRTVYFSGASIEK